jgi:5-methylthioadenosine/S-adenosylhomocysteine deaminase
VRTRILLRGGCVLTLGQKTPNFPRADLLIEDGRVAEVGPGLRARDAEVVDATDTIVMPGFVDTHRHTWRSLFRNVGDRAPTGARVADRVEPDDVYAGTLIGLLGAVEAGITTVVDWLDLPIDDRFVDAALQAHRDAGVRTVFVAAAGHGPEGREDPGGAVRRLVARLEGATLPSTTLAFGSAVAGPNDLGRIADDWAAARAANLPIHVHVGGEGALSRLAGQGLLGPDVTLVHCSGQGDADLDAVKTAGARVSLTPSSDMAGGVGPPPIQQLIDRGIRPGLGVDDERVSPGDQFAQMRATISLQHATVFDRKLAGKPGLPRLMSTRDVIRFATADGARVAGLGRVTGSLEPGMQADVIVLRTDRPNIFPINDPIGAVVWGMDTSNVDWVFAGGHALMREGALTADVERARALGLAARTHVAGATGLLAGAAREGKR